MAKRIRQVYKRTTKWRQKRKRVKARTKARWEKLTKERAGKK